MNKQLNYPTKPVVERGNRTPFADACRAVANLLVEDLKVDPEDTIALAIAKCLARAALAGKVNAAVALADRAEGKPRPVVQYEPGESASQGLDPEAMAMVMRIAEARCEARDRAAEPVGRG